MTNRRVQDLDGWHITNVAADSASTPAELDALRPDWAAVTVPGTVAGWLASSNTPHLDQLGWRDRDWWFRCSLPRVDPAVPAALLVDGLTPGGQVWIGEQLVWTCPAMFVGQRVTLDAQGSPDAPLLLRFPPDASVLDRTPRRPRARWRPQMVDRHQLRWVRTSLLGHLPGWCPPLPPVGPWRPIRVAAGAGSVIAVDLYARVQGESAQGTDEGVVDVRVQLLGSPDHVEGRVRLTAPGGSSPIMENSLNALRTTDGTILEGEVTVQRPQRWWPHTHGSQPLYPVELTVEVNGTAVVVDGGSVGFREIELTTPVEEFTLSVNGVPIFCRGACWISEDVARLHVSSAEYRASLRLLRDAGMNTVRVAGVGIYEHDAFYQICDELGILVLQDFMFANFDYPDNAAFVADAVMEAEEQVRRLRRHPCLTLFFGGSEVAQQAAMLGRPREEWLHRLFSTELPQVIDRLSPDVPYWPSSPYGGATPSVSNRGDTHYYGVGAYRQPLTDLLSSDVRFASECLAFANIPEDESLLRAELTMWQLGHDPVLKRGVPRDPGASWDFEDVRDHYLSAIFGVDAAALRAVDPLRYRNLSRVVPGEVMHKVFSQWRRDGSRCHGGLVWLWRDMMPGAGWGLLDVDGIPKAPYWYLRRALQPIAVFIVDEGFAGPRLNAVNDGAVEAVLTVTVVASRFSGENPLTADVELRVPPRGATSCTLLELWDHFVDLTFRYRFGPPQYEVISVRARDRTGRNRGGATLLPIGPPPMDPHLRLNATVQRTGPRLWQLRLTANHFAHAVRISGIGLRPDDNYVDLTAGEEVGIMLTATSDHAPAVVVEPLNAQSPTLVTLT